MLGKHCFRLRYLVRDRLAQISEAKYVILTSWTFRIWHLEVTLSKMVRLLLISHIVRTISYLRIFDTVFALSVL